MRLRVSVGGVWPSERPGEPSGELTARWSLLLGASPSVDLVIHMDYGPWKGGAPKQACSLFGQTIRSERVERRPIKWPLGLWVGGPRHISN